ncbi:hypothetical protein BB559_001654 [Furculomyces boomerangus]|uniref:Peptidase S1 domain-containing protein n=2 Tax=Harpellales TaxID=61421 RepID=A0A2T9Z155_9FUNG|nr:hypothetical protein BB559_001654 [Furculomyces boomerangus]PWA01506.1 hypothetical protein BB558_002400 [Smittium angustum]
MRASYLIPLLFKISLAASRGKRIVGGVPVIEGNHSFAVLISDIVTGDYCSGVLLSDEWVVTAAHCVENSEFGDIRVHYGSTVYKSMKHELAGSITIHPEFNIVDYSNDIALIKVQNSIDPNDAKPIKIYKNEISENQTLSVVGWGITDPDSDYSKVLMETSEKVISKEKCKEIYSAFDGEYAKNVICTGDLNGKGSCYGDSGGPLFIKTESGDYLVGIVSNGSAKDERYKYMCVVKDSVNLYTHVSKYTDFITKNVV